MKLNFVQSILWCYLSINCLNVTAQGVTAQASQWPPQNVDQSRPQLDQSDKVEALAYLSYAYLEGDDWVIPLNVWFSKPPHWASRLTGKAARAVIARQAGHDELSRWQKERFNQVSHDFLANNKSAQTLTLQFLNDPRKAEFSFIQNGQMLKSDLNGNLLAELRISNSHVKAILNAQNSTKGWASFVIKGQPIENIGRVRFIEPQGVSVISDIDDTIKLTNIPLGRKTVLNNTFFKPFMFAQTMQQMYQSFDSRVAFHYLSGAPWQLYRPLKSAMFHGNAFPLGSFHMKRVRVNPFSSSSYKDVARLIQDGSKQVTYEQKLQQIEQIFRHFPQRQFILIGDSGEKDPEVYRQIKARFPEQVLEIKIRDIVNAAHCSPERLKSMTVIRVLTPLVNSADCEAKTHP
ncbi:phosphatidate phosphatase App1 family protein [Aliikangiella sp. IMCC44653]